MAKKHSTARKADLIPDHEPTLAEQRAATEQLQQSSVCPFEPPRHPFVGETPQETIGNCMNVLGFLQESAAAGREGAADPIMAALHSALEYAESVLHQIGQEAGSVRRRRIEEAATQGGSS